MSDLDEKISQIMSGNFSANLGGSNKIVNLDSPARTRPSIPNSISSRLKSNSDDEDEIVEHASYDAVYNSLSNPIPPRESEPSLPRQDRGKLQRVDPFQQTVNLQQQQPSAVQILSSPIDTIPSPVGDSRDDGHDISFLGVVADNSGDIPYDLSVSDAQDHTFTMDDLTAANDIAKNLSSALDAKSAGNSERNDNAHLIQAKSSPARSTSQVPSSPAGMQIGSRPVSSSASTPSRIPHASRPPVATSTTVRSQSNSRGNNATPQKANSTVPTTPSRVSSNGPLSASKNKGTPGSVLTTPTRGQDRSRATSPDGTVGSNAAERVIRLAARVRPMSGAEQSQRARRTISKVGNDLVVVNPNSFQAEPDTIAAAAIAVNNSQWAHAFSFDQCLWSFDIAANTETIYDQPTVHELLGLEMVENVLNGVNVSCFVYGHSGSGKTYTMFGGPEPSQQLVRSNSSNSVQNKRTTSPAPHQRQQHPQSTRKMHIPSSSLQLTAQSGLVPRVFHDIVRTVKENQVSIRESRIFFSYYMVYNDMVIDLLVDPPSEPPREDQQDTIDSLRVREHPVYGPYVENLKRSEIFSVEDVFRLIAEGDMNRQLIQSSWHLSGSRYHAVASLDLTSADLNEILRVDPNRRVLLDNNPSSQGSIQQAIAQTLAMSGTSHLSTVTNNTGSNNTLPFRIDGDQFRHDSSGRVIKIQMVDLAGSESENQESSSSADEHIWSGTNFHDTTPNRRLKNVMDRDKKEMRSIRQSLTTLGFVIQSLAKGAATKSLPYRDSTLTFLLRDSLNGYQHTTLIGTVSSAHTQFDDTLSTLRYLEKFNLLMMHRRRISSGPTSSSSVPLGLSISKAALKEPRALLIDNFRKFHSDLDLHHKGSAIQRQLLKETVADPQQRIAKLTRGVNEATVAVYSSSPLPPTQNPNMGTGTPIAKQTSNPNVNMTFTSPIDGSLRRLRDITNEDLEHLQSSYRDLQSRVLEIQIDFDAVRTDRDTLMVELRATRERLHELEDDRDQAQYKTQNVNKALKNYEKEVMELRSQLRRREEENDHLMSELTEHKQARQGSEQAYHARTKEFLQRFDTVTKEKKALQAALEVASHKDSIFTNEKNDMMTQISRLKAELEQHVHTVEDQTIEIRVLRQELHMIKQVADLKDMVEQENFDLERDRTDLLMKLDGLVQDHQGLLTERDSLLAMIKQKDSLLWLQSQQSEASIKMLQQRQAALERAGGSASNMSMNNSGDGNLSSSGSNGGDFQKLLDSLRELFQREGQVFTSADGNAALDTATLITLIRELKEKIVIFDRIEQEFHALQTRYQTEVTLRQQADDKFYDLSRSLQSAEMSNAELSKQLVEVHRELEGMKRQNRVGHGVEQSRSPAAHHSSYRTSSTTTSSTINNVSSNVHHSSSTEISELHVRIEQYEQDIQHLQSQLQTSQRETQAAKEEVTATQNTMQREFASLWMSVQELNKLDALKDKSIQELIQERTQLTLERDTAVERLRATTVECETLRKELEEVDRDLQRAVGMDHRVLSRQQGMLVPPPASQASSSSSSQPQSMHQQQQHQHQQQNASTPQYAQAVLTSSPQHSVIFVQQPSQQQSMQQSAMGSASTANATTMVPVMMVPQQALSQMMLHQTQQQQQQQQPQPPLTQQQAPPSLPPPPPLPAIPQRATGSMRSSRIRYQDVEDDDDGLREEILMHQIEELTGFLHDEERLKRVRISSTMKNSSSPPATHAASFYQQHHQFVPTQPTSSTANIGGLFTPQQSSQKLTTRDLSAQRGRNNNPTSSSSSNSQQRRWG